MCLFDEFVEESEAVREFRCPLGVLVDAGIDELLHKAVLIAFVHAQAVYQPGQERRCGSEACARDWQHVRDLTKVQQRTLSA